MLDSGGLRSDEGVGDSVTQFITELNPLTPIMAGCLIQCFPNFSLPHPPAPHCISLLGLP